MVAKSRYGTYARRTMLNWKLLTCGAVICCCALACSEGKSCGAVGCGPVASIHIPLWVTDLASGGLLIEVCRNTECRSGGLYFSDTGQASFADINYAEGATSAVATCSSVHATLTYVSSTSSRMDIGWWWTCSSDQLSNGDRYRVNVTTSTGVAIDSVDTSVNYTTSTPNGDGCIPVYHSAEVTGADAGSN